MTAKLLRRKLDLKKVTEGKTKKKEVFFFFFFFFFDMFCLKNSIQCNLGRKEGGSENGETSVAL